MNQACQLFLGAPTGIEKCLGNQLIKGLFDCNLIYTAKYTDSCTFLGCLG